MKHIFIDANIFVSFFEIKSDNLSELEKLVGLVKSKAAMLWLPEQTKREFWRNREKSIKKYLQDFEQLNSLGTPPLLVREHRDFDELKNKAEEVGVLRREIAKSIKENIDKQKTNADKIIRKLFDVAIPIDTDNEEIFKSSWQRSLCHLPPGKSDDIGDRLCWVGLLKSLPEKATLHIVSDDSDYKNEGFSDDIRPYLEYEWRSKNGGTVKLWNRISQIISELFPDAENAIESEKTILALGLKNSHNFETTHELIDKLTKFENYNSEQLRFICEAIIENTQVKWIRSDNDVKEFYKKFIQDYKKKIGKEYLQEITSLIADDEE